MRMTRRTTRIAAIVASAVLLAGGCASSRSLSATWDDLGANDAISRSLRADDTYKFKDVDLTVFEGRVLLTGTVESAAEQRRLVELALGAKGVAQVIDETVIAPRTSMGRGLTDSRIDAAVRTRLTASSSIRASDVKVAVSRGSVYLIGVARDEQALEEILHTARRTRDVQQVISHVIYMDASDRSL